MGIDLLDIVDSYYQNTKPDWGSDEHNIARRVVREMAQDKKDKLFLERRVEELEAQRDQAVKALQLFVDVYKNIGKDYQIMDGVLWEAEKAIDLTATED